jgi:hypothetical protein
METSILLVRVHPLKSIARSLRFFVAPMELGAAGRA